MNHAQLTAIEGRAAAIGGETAARTDPVIELLAMAVQLLAVLASPIVGRE